MNIPQLSEKRRLPVLAIVANSLPPYRMHLHQRIAREMAGEIIMHTVCTHEVDYMHAYAPTPDIKAISFGPGHPFTRQLKLRYAPFEWLKAGRIIKWFESNQVDAVLVLGYNDVGRIRILRWCHSRGVPSLLFGDSNIRGDTAIGLKAAFKNVVVGWIVRQVTALMVCGRLGREYWQKYGAHTERLFDFPYEPDYELIRALPLKKIEEVRQRFNLRAERRRIVFSGRFAPAKCPDLLIDAFIALAHARPEWDLVFIGAGGVALGGGDRGSLEARVPDELKGRVVFTGFLEEQWMVSAIYRASDVLCLPSEFEPWALVVNEAAAAGMAIVATNVVGAAAELVRDGVNGRVFPPRDLRALTEALLDVTESDRIDVLRAGSADVLADWRRRGDPVNGLRMALKFAGVIRPAATAFSENHAA
ncbi:glycosyltransferase family 4 protein [Prosthecobacter sp.]|uniref:glycosyltransferase family 4 protein n=1 Tax=Prosthecobacter sp. TaxID=1965333 RepID=UPI002AB8360B|nr:glycosyltransferase family 4 protein [Prosthecobacter sp.]MDZ4401081.1 glycosyltransferase family 4 protein [Prosthecobacter sp.]